MAERPDEVPRQHQHQQTAGGGHPPHVDPQPAIPPQTRKSDPPTWAAMSGLGFEFVGAILLPGALGWWLDHWLGTRPWIMLALGLLGFVAGLRLLMRSVNRSAKR